MAFKLSFIWIQSNTHMFNVANKTPVTDNLIDLCGCHYFSRWIFKCLTINKTFTKNSLEVLTKTLCNVIQWLCILCFSHFPSIVFLFFLFLLWLLTFLQQQNYKTTNLAAFLKWHQIDMWFVELSTRQSIIEGNNWMLLWIVKYHDNFVVE